jgi:hypothetical protein
MVVTDANAFVSAATQRVETPTPWLLLQRR